MINWRARTISSRIISAAWPRLSRPQLWKAGNRRGHGEWNNFEHVLSALLTEVKMGLSWSLACRVCRSRLAGELEDLFSIVGQRTASGYRYYSYQGNSLNLRFLASGRIISRLTGNSGIMIKFKPHSCEKTGPEVNLVYKTLSYFIYYCSTIHF